jgi:energy-coupling factor transporter ATP-binding protein EcfA2
VAALALFKCQDLIYYYPDRPKPALAGINLQIAEGEFLLLIGGSGSGKSSLARCLAGLIPKFYGGRFGGGVYYRGQGLAEIDQRCLAQEVGIVFQDPEKQLVMTSVEAEVAFGLENLGLPQSEMRRRVAEVISFLDLTEARHEFTVNLSGGQKQKLALAAVLAMQPQVLILDEPTSQLDPVAAEELFNLIKRLNEELGLTIILIEQRLERCLHLADRVLLLADGQVAYDGRPELYPHWANSRGTALIPPLSSFFAQAGLAAVPLTIKEGRQLLRARLQREESLCGTSQPTSMRDKDKANCDVSLVGRHSNRKTADHPAGLPQAKGPAAMNLTLKDEVAVSLKKVWFTYPRGQEALQDINLQVGTGEFVAILGANSAGKTTLLKVVAGLLSPGRGQVEVRVGEKGRGPGRAGNRGAKSQRHHQPQPNNAAVAYLSQNPNDYLFHDTVEQELRFTLNNFRLPDEGLIDELLATLHLEHCRLKNPRDLSSGERQRVALASVLVARPRLLLLDEPTRGMDYDLKKELGLILTDLVAQGISVLLVTHDVEFAALYASRVIMMFAGQIICDGPTQPLLAHSFFYSTQIGKMCRGLADGILTLPQALARFNLSG